MLVPQPVPTCANCQTLPSRGRRRVALAPKAIMPSRGCSTDHHGKVRRPLLSKASTVLVPLFICTEHDLPTINKLYINRFNLKLASCSANRLTGGIGLIFQRKSDSGQHQPVQRISTPPYFEHGRAYQILRRVRGSQ